MAPLGIDTSTKQKNQNKSFTKYRVCKQHIIRFMITMLLYIYYGFLLGFSAIYKYKKLCVTAGFLPFSIMQYSLCMILLITIGSVIWLCRTLHLFNDKRKYGYQLLQLEEGDNNFSYDQRPLLTYYTKYNVASCLQIIMLIPWIATQPIAFMDKNTTSSC